MESLRRLTSSLMSDANARLSLSRRGSLTSLLSPTTAQAAISAQRQAAGLDLTFITDRLIVSGMPVNGATNKRQNQNNAQELAAFLEKHYAGQYLVFNLNALGDNVDVDDDTDEDHIAAQFQRQMLEFAWERDGMKAHTPSFDVMFRICYALFAWLALEPTHVALVHCQSGKTRTGVVIACYLLFTRLIDDPCAAFTEFYRQRWEMKALTPEALRKKTPPSIQRFLTCFHDLLENQSVPNPKPLVLKAIIFRSVPVELQPCVQIWDDYSMIFSSEDAAETKSYVGNELVIDWNSDDGYLAILWESGLDLDGGFSLLCSFGNQYEEEDNEDASSKVLFRYTDSTWFLAPGLITLTKSKMDMMKQYEHGFDDEQFSVDLVFHESNRAPRSRVAVDYTGNKAVRQGVGEITRHHLVLPDPSMHSNFIRMGFEDTAATLALQRTQNVPNAALDLLHSPGLAACFPQAVQCESRTSSPSPSPTKQETAPSAVHDVRQSTAEVAALQSQRSHYSSPLSSCASICNVCQEDDYMMRPQIVRCSGLCGQFYHTTCVGLKRIPFGLTTLSDRTNHAVYVKKYFSAWECDQCAPPSDGPVVTAASQRPELRSITGRVPPSGDSTCVPKSPENMKMEKLKEFLEISGVSVDDLLRAATTANVTISQKSDGDSSGCETIAEDGDAGITSSSIQAAPEIVSHVQTKHESIIESNGKVVRHNEDIVDHNKSDTSTRTTLGLANAQEKVPTKVQSDQEEASNVNVHSFSAIATNVAASTDIERRINNHSDARSSLMAAISARAGTTNKPISFAAHDSRQTHTTEAGEQEHRRVSPQQQDSPIQKSTHSALMASIASRKLPSQADTSTDIPVSQKTTLATALNPSNNNARSALMAAIAARKTRASESDESVTESPTVQSREAPNVNNDTDNDSQMVSNASIATSCNTMHTHSKTGEDAKATSESGTCNIGTTTSTDARSALMAAIAMRKPFAPGVVEVASQESLERVPDSDITNARSMLLGAILSRQSGAANNDNRDSEQSDKGSMPECLSNATVEPTNHEPSATTDGGASVAVNGDSVLLKDHETYGKYFKMLKMGFPEAVVRHKVQSDGVDLRVLELGPDATVLELTSLAPLGTKLKEQNGTAASKKRRKKLHWQPISEERLSSLDQETIWEEKDDDMMEFEMDMDELESLFFASDAPTSEKRRASTQAKPLRRKQAVTLIDAKRAMNAAISLARVKLSYAEIARAIVMFDACGLSLQQLMGIKEYLPTTEEVTAVSKYSGDVSVLGEAEKFMREVCKVPRYTARTECLVFKLAFPARSEELKTSVNHFISASEQVKSSRLLKTLLSMVLKLGNTLNGSDESTGIRGFTVDSLLRLGNTKAWNQKTTVLHYLVRLVKKNQPSVLDFHQELKSVPLAARESLELIDEDFAKCQDGLMQLSEEYQETQKDNEASENPSYTTIAAMHDAVEDIGRDLEQLELQIKHAREEIANVLDYFGEDRHKDPVEFFATLASFCNAFQNARKEVDAADDAAQRAERVRMRRTTSMKQSGTQQLETRKHRALSERFSIPNNNLVHETKH